MLIVYFPYDTSVLAIVLSQSSAAHLTGVAVRVASQPKRQRAKVWMEGPQDPQSAICAPILSGSIGGVER